MVCLLPGGWTYLATNEVPSDAQNNDAVGCLATSTEATTPVPQMLSLQAACSLPVIDL